MFRNLCVLGASTLALAMGAPAFAADMKSGPADGFDIHVMAPHKMEDGSVAGPFHHYCKAIKPEILQCLLFESTNPNAVLTAIRPRLLPHPVGKIPWQGPLEGGIVQVRAQPLSICSMTCATKCFSFEQRLSLPKNLWGGLQGICHLAGRLDLISWNSLTQDF